MMNIRPATQPTLVELAEHATAMVHALNHRTRGRHGLSEPAELARLLGELTAFTSGLPQLLDQLHRWLDHEHRDGQLRTDDHTDPGPLLTQAGAKLDAASLTARQLTAQLDHTHQYLAQLAAAEPKAIEQPGQVISFHL